MHKLLGVKTSACKSRFVCKKLLPVKTSLCKSLMCAWLSTQVHLHRLIRENDRTGFGVISVEKYDDDGTVVGLQLDRSNPDVAVLMSKDTVIPGPEADFASKKLFQFVESRKEMTAQLYRFFAEHAHSQFFQLEAFNQSARARTRTKDLDAGDFHPSTKLKGYVWIGTKDNFVHVPQSQAGAVEMVEGDADEEEEKEEEERIYLTNSGSQDQTSTSRGRERRICRLSKRRGNITSLRTL